MEKMKMGEFLKEGDVIEIKEGHTVYAFIPETYAYSNKPGSFKLVKHNVKIKNNSWNDYLIGKYVVSRTSLEGGSDGRDFYPNGHHVFCENIESPNIEINFYQSGSFSAMITDIKPLGKAIKTVSWEFE